MVPPLHPRRASLSLLALAACLIASDVVGMTMVAPVLKATPYVTVRVSNGKKKKTSPWDRAVMLRRLGSGHSSPIARMEKAEPLAPVLAGLTRPRSSMTSAASPLASAIGSTRTAQAARS